MFTLKRFSLYFSPYNFYWLITVQLVLFCLVALCLSGELEGQGQALQTGGQSVFFFFCLKTQILVLYTKQLFWYFVQIASQLPNPPRVSKSCNHAITQLRKIFKSVRKLWTNERKPGKSGTKFHVFGTSWQSFSSFTCFYVIFNACFCAKFSSRAFSLHKIISF